MTVISADGTIISSDLSWKSEIRVRGNTTAWGAKRPYYMKFKEKADLFGFGAAKKWVLIADMYDPSLWRNKVAFDLAEKLGLTATPGHQKIEVWVDGKYRGLYLLTEKIEVDKNRVDIDTKTGDFLIEIAPKGQINTAEGEICLTAKSGRTYRLREPEKAEKAEEITAIINDFESALASGKWEQVELYIDVDSFVSYYVLNEFMKIIDFSGVSAYYYYKDGKFYGGPAWDFDWSTGNRSDNADVRDPNTAWINRCNYYIYLTKIPEFRAKIFERFSEISNLLTEIYKAGGKLDTDINYYAEAIARNFEIWDEGVSYILAEPTPFPTYQENVDYLKTWLKARHEWMKNYFPSYQISSLGVAIAEYDAIEVPYGQNGSLSLNANVKGHFTTTNEDKALGAGEYSIAWSTSSKDLASYDMSFNNGVVSVGSQAVVGSYQIPVTVTVTSGNLTASANTIVSVKINDVAPVLDKSEISISVHKGEPVNQIVTATAGTNLKWKFEGNLPNGLEFSNSQTSATISGTPQLGTTGNYYGKITASNSAGSKEINVIIKVTGSVDGQTENSGSEIKGTPEKISTSTDSHGHSVTASTTIWRSASDFRNSFGEIILSADIQITTEAEKFAVSAENDFSTIVSVDVKIQNADPDFSEYFYSMDVTAPDWIKITGTLESSDALIKGANVFHYDLILSGTPGVGYLSEDLIVFNAEIKISGDVGSPILVASLSRDVKISVLKPSKSEPEPEPVPVIPTPDPEPEPVIPDPAPVISEEPEIITPVKPVEPGEIENKDKNKTSDDESPAGDEKPQSEDIKVTPEPKTPDPAPNSDGQINDIQPDFETISAQLESSTLDITSNEGKKIIIEAMRDIIPDDNQNIEIADITNDPDAEIGAQAEASDIDESSVPPEQKIAVTFNRVKITKAKIFVFKGSSRLPAGSPLYFIVVKSEADRQSGFVKTSAETDANGQAVFFDTDGNEITATTQDNQEFNVAAYIMEGEFIPIVTSAAPDTDRLQTASGSGGGCDLVRSEELGVRSVLVLALFLLGLMEFALIKFRR